MDDLGQLMKNVARINRKASQGDATRSCFIKCKYLAKGAYFKDVKVRFIWDFWSQHNSE